MALIRDTNTRFGITASYWKVGMFTIDTNLQEVNFSFNLYLNKDAETFIDTYCVSDLMGLEDKTLYKQYFSEDKGQTYKDWQTACYEFAKEHVEFFKDAQDDEEYVIELLGVE